MIKTLSKSNLTLESVPTKNQHVVLRENSCLSEGGTTVECTEMVNPEIEKLALKALGIVNLKLGGVDIICEDIRKNPSDQKIAFLEINSRPSLDIHHFPNKGKSINVTKIILSNIFN